MDTIINPVDGIKYSLHSTRGRELLKLYINNYKSGGSATLAGSPWIFENAKRFLNNAVDSVKGIFKRRDDTLEASMRDADASRFTMNPIFEVPKAAIPDKRSGAARKIQRKWRKTKQKLLDRPVSPFTALLRKADGKFPRPIQSIKSPISVRVKDLSKDFFTRGSPVTEKQRFFFRTSRLGPIPKDINEVRKQNRKLAVKLTGLKRLGQSLKSHQIKFLNQQSSMRKQRNESPEDFEREVRQFILQNSDKSFDPMRDIMSSDSSSSDEIDLDDIPLQLWKEQAAWPGTYGSSSSLSSSYT